MTDCYIFIKEQIVQLVPMYDKIEMRASISDSSCSIEFFVTVNGKRMQCFDMIDNDLIKESDFDIVANIIAEYVRNTTGYKKGEVNKFSFVFD